MCFGHLILKVFIRARCSIIILRSTLLHNFFEIFLMIHGNIQSVNYSVNVHDLLITLCRWSQIRNLSYGRLRWSIEHSQSWRILQIVDNFGNRFVGGLLFARHFWHFSLHGMRWQMWMDVINGLLLVIKLGKWGNNAWRRPTIWALHLSQSRIITSDKATRQLLTHLSIRFA